MTIQEYYDKLLCYNCSYGTKALTVTNKLSLGISCDCSVEDLATVKYLIDQFEKFPLTELTSFPGTSTVYSEDEFYKLMNKIENLL
jgi:hypothetical protein